MGEWDGKAEQDEEEEEEGNAGNEKNVWEVDGR